MAGLPITAEDLNRAQSVIAAHGRTIDSIGRENLARAMGVTSARARTILDRLRHGADQVSSRIDRIPACEEPVETVEIKEGEALYSLPKTDIHTLEQLVEYFQVDLTKWKVKRFVANKWDMGYTSKEKEPDKIPLYQVKAWFEPNVEAQSVAVEIAAMIEEAKSKIRPAFPVVNIKPPTSGNMVEISIADQHLGKLAWNKETGGADYDLGIAKRLYIEAAERLVAATNHYKPERILLIVGNDIIHSNGVNNTTFGGTPLDVDSRYPKVFTETRQMVSDVVGTIRKIAPVDIVIVRGNHDWESAFHLGDSLSCWFHSDSRVTVDNTPKMRKYVEWGVNGLMFTHGHKGKKRNFPLLSAVEQRAMFGRTKFNEVHLGNWHKREMYLDEECGIAVRILPSLCPADAWHADMGFVGNIRAAEAYVWNKSAGLIGTSMHTILEAA